MTRILKNFLTFAAVAYCCTCLTACMLQRQILYHPTHDISGPAAYGLTGFEDVRLTDKDGTEVDSWYKAARPGYPTLVYFHGNGGTMANRAEYFRALSEAGFGLLAIDYRGYGASGGSASEEGLYQDGRAAVHYLTDTRHIPLNRIVLYGESLGTGVAVQMATEFETAAVVLQSPYTSIEDIAQHRFPYLPVHFLLIDRFDSYAKIDLVHTNLLLIHGRTDTVIPLRYGEKLFAKANEPKEIVYFPDKGHNDLDVAARLEAVTEFSRKYGILK